MMRCDRIIVAMLILAGICQGADLVPVPALGLRVARGFRVSLYADAEMAHDISAMALDARGNAVVTGPGYIRTLLDPSGVGRATTFREFAQTKTGGQGLCFDGNSLYFVGDGVLGRYVDADGDGVADGPLQTLVALSATANGGHSVRKGPDGAIYFSAGKDVHLSIPSPAMPAGQAGGIFRFISGGPVEPLAHGVQNPCDFDFNWIGDLFTSDTDAAGELFLPWYTPARLFHVAYAGQHGFRLEGTARSWSHPEFYPDTVNALVRLGPDLVKGMVSYRHSQFPARYRDGLFFCDWAFGRVYYLPLQPAGASYQGGPELFLEATGANGFAPSDLVVTPDGALLISTGGGKTRGGVYRVEFGPAARTARVASEWWRTALTEIEAVVMSPQPMEAWSRAWWVPVAMRIGAPPFAALAADPSFLIPYRVRAIEILTELHGGLSADTAALCAQASPTAVRARVAWSLGRIPPPNFAPIIVGLAKDPDPTVRRCALESILQQIGRLELPALQQAIGANLTHPDKRIRQCAARLAALLPDAGWQALWGQQLDPQARLTTTLGFLWRTPPGELNQPAIEAALGVLAQTRNPDHRLQALGLLVLALGDYHFQNPSLEAYTGYESPLSFKGQEALVSRLRAQVRAIFPTGAPLVDSEAARLLAILEDNDATTSAKVLGMITEASPPAADFHYLTVLSRLTGRMPPKAGPALAQAIFSLDRKLAGREHHLQLHWEMRLVEISDRLLRREPSAAEALAADKSFASPAHVNLVPLLEGENYLKVAGYFQAAVRQNPNADWPEPVLTVLEALPEQEVNAAFRQLWVKSTWRDQLIYKLAASPDLADQDKFLASLGSAQPHIRQASLSALLRLPRDSSKRALLAGARLLLKLCSEPAETAARAQALAFINRSSAQSFKVQENGSERPALLKAYQPVFRWIAAQDPEGWKSLEMSEAEDPANWRSVLAEVPWERGDPGRGAGIFRDRGCEACHSSESRIGPDLGGVAQRYALTNLFYAIAYPSRHITPAYRSTTFQVRGGQSYTGLIAYESPEVILLNTGARSTVRLYDPDIISRELSNISLMPVGLLNGLRNLSFADLYSYLLTLPVQ